MSKGKPIVLKFTLHLQLFGPNTPPKQPNPYKLLDVRLFFAKVTKQGATEIPKQTTLTNYPLNQPTFAGFTGVPFPRILRANGLLNQSSYTSS